MGQFEKAVEHNSRAVALKPDFGMAHNNLAVAFFYAGNAEHARDHAKKALDLGYEVNPAFLEQIDMGCGKM
jgi:Flp pilus assembly protein TadD